MEHRETELIEIAIGGREPSHPVGAGAGGASPHAGGYRQGIRQASAGELLEWNELYRPDSRRHCHLGAVEQATRLEQGRVRGRFREFEIGSDYQPIYSLAHRRPVGYEALASVRGSDGAPAALSGLFDEPGLDSEGTVFLDRLCRNVHLRNFPTATGDATGWLFLNVHPHVVLHGAEHGSYFAALLERYRFPAHRVVIEIVEQAIDDEARLAEAVRYYKNLGCLVAIDDFGAGGSGIGRIWRLAPQFVKFDRSMLQEARVSAAARRILSRFVALVHECGSLTLLEGIESEQDALIAIETGFDLVQGYLLGQPAGDPRNGNGCGAIPALCVRYRNAIQVEMQRQRQRLAGPWHDFRQAARLLESGIDLARACARLLGRAEVRRCYLLDAEGRQIGMNLLPTARALSLDPRLAPFMDGTDAVWARRDYFREAMERPGEIYVSRPYLSMIDARMCATLSVALPDERRAGPVVLACDIDCPDDA